MVPLCLFSYLVDAFLIKGKMTCNVNQGARGTILAFFKEVLQEQEGLSLDFEWIEDQKIRLTKLKYLEPIYNTSFNTEIKWFLPTA